MELSSFTTMDILRATALAAFLVFIISAAWNYVVGITTGDDIIAKKHFKWSLLFLVMVILLYNLN